MSSAPRQFNADSPQSLVDQSGPFTHIGDLLRFATSRHEAVQPGRTPRLLDLRCGSGRLASTFASQGWDVVGLDASVGFVGQWKEIHHHPGACSFVVADSFSGLPVNGGNFDLIVALDDSAVELLDSERLVSLLGFAVESLAASGHFVFQVERSTAWPVTDPTDLAVDIGFDDAWRSTLLDLGHAVPQDIAHRGSRDLIVSRMPPTQPIQAKSSAPERGLDDASEESQHFRALLS